MMKPIRYSQFNLDESYIYGIKKIYVVCHHIFLPEVGRYQGFEKSGKQAKKQVINPCRGATASGSNRAKRAGPTSCLKCFKKIKEV
jgi:hypothetical protein